mgnify:CR=1 FL=1
MGKMGVYVRAWLPSEIGVMRGVMIGVMGGVIKG